MSVRITEAKNSHRKHCNLVNFAGHLSDTIKFSAGQSEILLVLSGRSAVADLDGVQGA